MSKRAIGLSIIGIVECFAFTVESQEDFPDNWLSTLDLNIQVDAESSVNYKCLKKGTPLHSHRSTKLSFVARRFAKLTGKSNWFRKPRTGDKDEDDLTFALQRWIPPPLPYFPKSH